MNSDFMWGASLAADEDAFMHGARGTQAAQTPDFMHGLNLLADAANVTPAIRERQGDITGNAAETGGLAAAPHFTNNMGIEVSSPNGRTLFPNTPAAYTPGADGFMAAATLQTRDINETGGGTAELNGAGTYQGTAGTTIGGTWHGGG